MQPDHEEKDGLDGEATRLRREWQDLQRERQQLDAETGTIEKSKHPIEIQEHRARLYAHNCRLYSLWEDLERFHMRRGVITDLIPQGEE